MKARNIPTPIRRAGLSVRYPTLRRMNTMMLSAGKRARYCIICIFSDRVSSCLGMFCWAIVVLVVVLFLVEGEETIRKQFLLGGQTGRETMTAVIDDALDLKLVC